MRQATQGDLNYIRGSRWRWAIVAIVFVAAALRLWRLDQFPPGLSVDEAYNLIDAQRILDGARPLFLPDNAGREALYSYWQALLMAVLGPNALALRVASALIGIATVALTPWCFVALPWPQARLTALLTAALLAGLFWHTLFSRFGIRAISLPLIALLLFGLLWRGIASGRWPLYALAGMALGAALYTGTAARVLPLAPALSLLWLAWTDRPRARHYLGGLALVLGVAALVVLPLALYFMAYPQQFTSHLGEVAVSGGELLSNVPRVLGLFNLRGDAAWWRNLAGRPAFDPLVGLLFLAGLVLVVRDLLPSTTDGRPTTAAEEQRRGTGEMPFFPTPPLPHSPAPSAVGGRWSAVACLIWLTVMLLPTLAADAAPNFSRAIGILPVVCVFPARALALGWAWLRARQPALATPALGTLLLISLAWSTWDYFVVYAARPEPYYAYDADKVAAARALRQVATEGAVYATPSLAEHSTVRALTGDLDLRAFDATRGLVLADGAATYVGMAGVENGGDSSANLTRLSAVRQDIADDQGQPLLVAYHLKTPPPSEVRAKLGLKPGQARFGNAIGLSGYAVSEGTQPVVSLMWTALASLDRDWTVFVHLVDAQGKTVAQADGEPLGASYPTSRWQVGERVIEWRTPDKPLSPGSYRVRVGWYDRATGERLPLPGQPENAFELGGVEVKP